MSWQTLSTCESMSHQDYDCLIHSSVNKKFAHAKWCTPCQVKQAERAARKKEEK